MKQLVFLITGLIALSNTVYAQTEQGNITIGGSIGYSNNKTETEFSSDKGYSINFNPNISYAIIDNLFVGISLPYTISKNTNTSIFTPSIDTNFSRISVGPNVRYYHSLGQLSIFPELSYVLGQSITKGDYFDLDIGDLTYREDKGELSELTVGLGIAYFINNNISIEGLLSYHKQEQEYNSNRFIDSEHKFLRINIGVNVFLQTKN